VSGGIAPSDPDGAVAPVAGRSPLAHSDWVYVERPSLDEFRAEDWAVLDRQRHPYYREQQAAQLLRMLEAQRDDPTFGYQINNYGHSLQAATMVWHDGHDEETVVVALLHDLGFVACPETHGDFAAALLAAYVSERHRWMLEHHQAFQQLHLHEYPRIDRHAREQWRGHPHFAWTAEFVERYDIQAIRAAGPTAPLEVFAPMVHRLLARGPHPVPEDQGSRR
jgi:predicted HD phosphohydrolase